MEFFPFLGVRARLVNPPCQEGSPVDSCDGFSDDVLRRTLSCLRANGFAKCMERSQDWHKKASSAAQNHRARLHTQPSHALAVLPPMALACFLLETMNTIEDCFLIKSKSRKGNWAKWFAKNCWVLQFMYRLEGVKVKLTIPLGSVGPTWCTFTV